jgi:O-antigen/teichoic acid export membrane protein
LFRAIAGNFFTKAWTALLGIVAVPFLPRFLGPEAFGIVSFVLVVQAAVNLLDFGLSNSITRQVALHHAAGEWDECIGTIRTLEAVYWAIGALICGALIIGSQRWGTSWLHPEALPPDSVGQSLFWASLAVTSLWPMTFYSGALMGLERYTAANLVNAGSLTLRQIGGIFVAWSTGGNLPAFFMWQFIASLLPVLIAAVLVWRASGVRIGSPVRWHLLHEQKNLLSGMALSTGAMLVFTQLDKIVLSRLLPLSEFGLYSIAWTAAGIFYLFYSPVAAIGLPRFTKFAASGDRNALVRSYSLASQIVGIGVIPTAAVLVIYSRPILTIWLHDKTMATSTAPLLQMLAPFAAAGALAYIPAVFQWAQGWTAPTSVTNLVASVVLGPSLYFAYRSGGTRVAIVAWGILRIGQATWQVAWAHRRLLPDQSIQWFWKSVGLPAIIGAGVCLLAQRWLSAEPGIAVLFAIWLLAVFACLLAAAELRDTIALQLERLHFRPSVSSEARLPLLAGRADTGGGE